MVLPSTLLQAEPQAQLKAMTRGSPSLPSKETLAGWLGQRVVAGRVPAGALAGTKEP